MEQSFDPQAVAEARNKAIRNAEYAEFLRTFRWDYFVTGTLKEAVVKDTLLIIMKTWLSPFRDAYAAVGIQRGSILEKYHVHAAIGGIGHGALNSSGYNSPETFLRGTWVRDGHVKIAQFSPGLGGIEYMIAQTDEIEIIGSLVRYKPRHIRGRRYQRR
jgi:hypothetical protein